ncbi:hypothetical protein QFZ23_000576 [Arthrobacter globiformis]|nr:hypothetical protein [Arthrobacter globiformis]MDQ1056675.1 hypothetical protein [Arthrobacter globiformis]
MLIALAATGTAALLWLAVTATVPPAATAPTRGMLLGIWAYFM